MVVVKANGQGRVSIHAPHARGDRSSHSCRTPSMSFNPRPSCEGRLLVERRQAAMYGVSIHAPHARGDRVGEAERTKQRRFNPRPSCEGRQLDVAKLSTSHTRYSTGFYKVSLRNPLLCNCHGAIEPKKCEPYVSLMTA